MEMKDFPPLMSDGEKNFFVRTIKTWGGKRYLEFGCGGSTFLAMDPAISAIASVDSDKTWLQRLKQQIETLPYRNIEICLYHVDIGEISSFGYPVEQEKMHRFPLYSSAVFSEFSSPDIVLIDGRFRVACALQTALNAHAGTGMLIHDFNNRPEYHCILEFWDILDTMDTMALLKLKNGIDRNHVAAMYDEFKFQPF